ncbi:hypothetical protein CVIRNUC_002190 [Coccomyxa viridis]|uniref:Uncharacterized protein n=1 Tax=Coccomyxa viridis TaxID=1274662 RepID=A0AAV1HVR7_9CHLO|nr:hypothetical protein CVIRNUC_002190 [Coccomyxa viridis]
MPHAFSPRTSVMQVQAQCGPLMTAMPSEVPFIPVVGAAQSQQYVAAPRPLEPRSQDFAASYAGPRPDGKRNRQWNGKKAQQRSRKKTSVQTNRAHFNAMKKANRQQTRKHFKSLAQTPHTLPPGSVTNAAQNAVMVAMKPGACHLPDPFSPTSTPASTRDGGHPDDDLDFFSTNIGIVQNYPSDSATEAGGSDSEDEGVAAAVVVEDRSAAYVMSLEQENESLKQINLNLQEEIWVLKQQLEEQAPSAEVASPEPSHEEAGAAERDLLKLE